MCSTINGVADYRVNVKKMGSAPRFSPFYALDQLGGRRFMVMRARTL